MRNKHLLEQFMQENGIEYDVPFTVERTGFLGEKVRYEFKITKSDDYTGFELSHADNTKQMGNSLAVMQELMFSDIFKIVKKPWKPEDGEKYWYVWFDKIRDYKVSSSNWEEHSADFNRYIVGNCFKTEEEAHKHIYDIIQILQHGEPLVKWEE